MAEVTVAEFAQVLKVPVDRLIVQLDEAGIKVSGADDVISEDAKLELLTHLRRAARPQGSRLRLRHAASRSSVNRRVSSSSRADKAGRGWGWCCS